MMLTSNDQKKSYFYGIGRRKKSVARVRVKKGNGSILINNKHFEDYFCYEEALKQVKAPLLLVNKEKMVDIIILVNGGGLISQSKAISLGISRALQFMDNNLRKILKENKFLRRDSRIKERKKSGQPGARKKFQFSKR